MQTAEMRRMRGMRVSLADIAQSAGITRQAVFYRLGGQRKAKRPSVAANSNIDRRNVVTRVVPFNGGCSTASGLAPVTLRRVPTIDGVAEDGAAA
ncbi:hypothetical protein [Consotaella salsifontis]|uniref:Uncharacterized protein n=1 Tax=Consotaella salsifontis TaxID=1365950 RepID=A0A1T4RW69_9HYPH|nr:hypothetical protein [Consotaella salsifontis]SKA20213.1 hypothetical protein SAMN05428963_10823 [Consotaella salsifontis]